jgi:hypothetical protein
MPCRKWTSHDLPGILKVAPFVDTRSILADVNTGSKDISRLNHDTISMAVIDKLQCMKPGRIFNMDGEIWKLQRKSASLEFSSKTLRDYSADAFRKYTLNLTMIFQGQVAHNKKVSSMRRQPSLMSLMLACDLRCGCMLDSCVFFYNIYIYIYIFHFFFFKHFYICIVTNS